MEFALGISALTRDQVFAQLQKKLCSMVGQSVSQSVSCHCPSTELLIDSDDAAAAAVQSINCRHCRVPLLAAVVLFVVFLFWV